MEIFNSDEGETFVHLGNSAWLCIGSTEDVARANPSQRTQMVLDAMMDQFRSENPELFPKVKVPIPTSEIRH